MIVGGQHIDHGSDDIAGSLLSAVFLQLASLLIVFDLRVTCRGSVFRLLQYLFGDPK